MSSIDPGHNRTGVEWSEQEGNDPVEVSKEEEVYLFGFRNISSGLDQRGQRSQRLSALEEGVL